MKQVSFTKLINLIFPLFLITVTGIICYRGAFDVPFVFDDTPSIVKNDSIKNLGDLKSIWQGNSTRFLAYLSFAVNFHIHGLDPFGYHMVNLMIHLFTALVLYWFVRLLFLTPELKEHPINNHAEEIALIISLLFVSHPIQTQAVTYIVQRTTSMAAFFYLLSLMLYTKARIGLEKEEHGHIVFYAGSIITALLAMFTKEISITLPINILVLEFFLFSPSLKKLYKKLSYLLPMILTLPVVPLTHILSRKEMVTHIGMAAETGTISRTDYLLTQINVISDYLGLLFLPINQSIDFDHPVSHNFFELQTIFSSLLLMVLFVLSVLLFKKSRIVSFGIIWFFLTLMVESSLIPIRDVMFEHRLYLPSVGIFLSASVLIVQILKDRRKTLFVFVFIIISLLSMATVKRNILWQKPILLWHDAVAKENIKARTMNNLGASLLSSGRLGMALSQYDRAVKQFPHDATIHFNRGMAHQLACKPQKALHDYTRSIEIYPAYHRAYFYRGIAYIQLGQDDKALENMNMAARISDKDSDIFYNRSCLYFTKGKYNKALKDADRAIALEKKIPFYYRNRALIYLRLNMSEKALKDLTTAIELDPDYANAYFLRGKIYMKMKKSRQAEYNLKRATMLKNKKAR